MDRLSAVLGQAVQFVYTCWDRIVLNRYLERLERPEYLVHFFHDVVGIACSEPAVLEQRTIAYKAWVRQITDDQGIPVLSAPRGTRKEELVAPYYRRLKTADDTRHFGVGRRLDKLPLLREKLMAANEPCLALKAELLASPIDGGQLAALAGPTIIGRRRIPA